MVADELGGDRFGVIGLSGGGPYVLACAEAFPDRVVAGIVLGGVAPTVGDDTSGGGPVELTRLFRIPLGMARVPVAIAFAGLIRALKPFGHQALQLYSRISPPGDRIAFASPGMEEMFLDDLNHAAASGGLGAATADLTLFGRHWGFSVRDIRVPCGSGTATPTTSSPSVTPRPWSSWYPTPSCTSARARATWGPWWWATRRSVP